MTEDTIGVRPTEVDGPIERVFERMADAHAARTAVHTAARSFTYGQLESAANRIANDLLARRGSISEPVPLIVADPALMLTAALGVLKAGKFYVPVNPHFPPRRVALVLADVKAALAVCDRKGASAWEQAGGTEDAIQLEDVLTGRRPDTRPAMPGDPEKFAYILYTSGSVGRPKGVVQTHRGVVHNIFRHKALRTCPDDCVTLLTADGFVAAVSNPFMALLNGASLAPYSFRQNGVHGMLEWTKQVGITVFYAFPSFFRQFVAATAPTSGNRGVRLVYLGGESVFPSDITSARRVFPGAAVAVGLNSTETGLTTLNVIAVDEEPPKLVVSVGRPVPGVNVTILDESGRPAAAGTAGEIAVTSEYVRPVYWSEQPGPSPRRAPHPFRTGDRGYLTEAGELVHLGRLDSMVKVRGYRVELTEVESSLSTIPGVDEAVVVPYSPLPDVTELVAYVVARRHDDAALRRSLADVLPELMVPSAFVFMDVLPRTDNGKVNRRALPDPPVTRTAGPVAQYIPPRNAIEDEVARIWCSVLSVAQVGVGDNFFELGGHSLTALRVISLVRERFGVPVPLRVLFETPTITRLGEEIALLRKQLKSDDGTPARETCHST